MGTTDTTLMVRYTVEVKEVNCQMHYLTACALATASLRTDILILANGRNELSVRT